MPKDSVRILLMEDDAGMARLCRKALEKAGYAVDHASDGEEGLAMCKSDLYDVVLMDHAMPVHDGLEVIRRLASQHLLPPTVMVTGAGNERVAVEAMKLGAYDYVVKDPEAGYLNLLPAIVERALRRRSTEERARLAAIVFENAGEGIMVTDPEGEIVSVNSAFTAITGYTAEEVTGKNPRLLQSGRHDAKFYAVMWDALAKTGRWRGEIWNRRKNGEAYPAWLTINVVKDPRGRVGNYAGIFSDITVRKQAEERLRYLATHDALTGLPNREMFQDRINRSLALSRREKKGVAVMMLDLDGFKPVNDALGHATGDYVLQDVASRISDCLRDADTAARLGGDEFAILLPNIPDREAAFPVARRILEAISEPFVFDGRKWTITASIGISFFPEHSEDPESLLKNADTAMYRAKERRNCYSIFHPDGAGHS